MLNARQSRVLKSSIALACLIAAGTCAPNSSALAESYSPALYGSLGLNTIPSARMDPVGTIRLGTSTLDPYVHATLGFQLAAPLSVVLRQSAEVSNINEDPDRLYPGLDVKLRLFDETRSRPAMAIGIQSAAGHKRMAAEYLTLSKRYKDFDFTAGLGWGRMGTAGTFSNPLKIFGNHFSKDRDLDGEMPNEPSDWFTGDEIGLFGGVEYFTPVDGLSLKLDWGADRYDAEKTSFNYNAPAPWSAGLAYQATDWANVSLGVQGTDKIIARLSLSGGLSGWRDRETKYKPAPHLRRFRTGLALAGEIETDAERDSQALSDITLSENTASAFLNLEDGISTPTQISHAAIRMANHSSENIEELVITPTKMGLRGTSVRLMRKDLERAIAQKEGSADEIWRNAKFEPGAGQPMNMKGRKSFSFFNLDNFQLTLDNHLSLSEEDSGALYRTSLLVGQRTPGIFRNLHTGYEFRLDLKNNFDRIASLRPPAILPVRSDVDEFADNRFSLDRLYVAYMNSFRNDLHVSLIGGYLEEMYEGAGGEILYRPFGSRFAVGAEAWFALKRQPDNFLNLDLNGDQLLTGHVNAWYDIPGLDLTLHGKAGRYLAEDLGATIGLQKTFKNGATLEGFVTITDFADADLFGGTTHAYNGVRLSVPLGGFKYMPSQSHVRLRAEAAGRDTGQSLDNPLPLYSVTDPFSKQHMATHWDRITPEQ